MFLDNFDAKFSVDLPRPVHCMGDAGSLEMEGLVWALQNS